MKIAVSSTGRDLDAPIDQRFGRCAYFAIVETDDMSFQVVANESASLGGGAGIQSAQLVAAQGAEFVITGNCGPNAINTLSAAGVKLIAGQSGTVRDAVERFKKGELKVAKDANVPRFYGSGAGGMGMGGGRERGMGRGMGGGGGMGGGKGLGKGRQ